jgi:hypothetical protein
MAPSNEKVWEKTAEIIIRAELHKIDGDKYKEEEVRLFLNFYFKQAIAALERQYSGVIIHE